MANLPTSFLSDLLDPTSVTLDMRRNDEQSGSGDGRYWTAELARPLWTVDVQLNPVSHAVARMIDSRVRELNGSQKAFLFADPTYPGPAYGSLAGLSAVTVASISTDRTAIALSGLPAGYEITKSDRLSIAWGTDRVYFAEFNSNATASAGGVTGEIAVTPYLPMGIAAGAVVELVTPTLRVIVPPGGYTPFTIYAGYAGGASIKMLQKA